MPWGQFEGFFAGTFGSGQPSPARPPQEFTCLSFGVGRSLRAGRGSPPQGIWPVCGLSVRGSAFSITLLVPDQRSFMPLPHRLLPAEGYPEHGRAGAGSPAAEFAVEGAAARPVSGGAKLLAGAATLSTSPARRESAVTLILVPMLQWIHVLRTSIQIGTQFCSYR